MSWDGCKNTGMLQPTQLPQLELCRRTSFFNELTANQLWEGVIAVSNAGRKRGRGKRVGRKKITDLNRGQALGTGKANIVWPGLNAPIIKGREVMKQKQLPPNPDREAELVKLRDKMSKIRYTALPPLQRGWCGSRFPGQSVGHPDDVGDYEFEGFDTKVLEFKLVTNMTGTLGRKQRFTAFVVTGNKNGLAGFGLGRSQNGKGAIRIAKNRAAQNLMYIPLYEDHTVFHNMYTKYHRSKIFIHKKEKGYGLNCHRVLKTICELIGIKDMHAKVEGSTKNMQTVTKAFFGALVHQETHQELADRTKLNVVEFRKERNELPEVVAAPSTGGVSSSPLVDEEEDLEVDFDRLYYGGKTEHIKPKPPPFYHKLPSYKKKMKIVHLRRNQSQAQIMRLAGLW